MQTNSGLAVLENPVLNKSTGFSAQEKEHFHLVGLLFSRQVFGRRLILQRFSSSVTHPGFHMGRLFYFWVLYFFGLLPSLGTSSSVTRLRLALLF